MTNLQRGDRIEFKESDNHLVTGIVEHWDPSDADDKIIMICHSGNIRMVPSWRCRKIKDAPAKKESRMEINAAESLKRKVVQIAVGTETVALCDDGTVWMLAADDDATWWNRLPFIPQVPQVQEGNK